MDRLLLLCFGLAVLSYSFSQLYRVVALALHIVDKPDHRSAHKDVTPTGAGAVFVVLYCLGLLIAAYAGEFSGEELVFLSLLIPLAGIALVGMLDDYVQLSWRIRAIFHLVAASYGIWLIGFPLLQVGPFTLDLGVAGLLFGVIALAWLTNLYNFMDGIDGIAAGEALFVLTSSGFISVFLSEEGFAVPVLILTGVLAGFLVINWPKAKVFMGDVGSGFLGFLLGLMILTELQVNVWCWLILLGWFITDSCLTIVIRLIRSERIYEAHSLHAYQHLNRAVGTGYTLFLIGAVNIVWLLPLAALSQLNPGYGAVLLVLAYSPLLLFQFYCGAGQILPRMLDR